MPKFDPTVIFRALPGRGATRTDSIVLVRELVPPAFAPAL